MGLTNVYLAIEMALATLSPFPVDLPKETASQPIFRREESILFKQEPVLKDCPTCDPSKPKAKPKAAPMPNMIRK